ncbi:class I SAM-dependent methyltransferase [Ferrimonas senticii]|uniref:class I SAM-dependent methyltransferase n=1 Tax=Ferrimonas senticii TaxID=394566 RepID=UPI000424A068|nr:class I SAM-dependent methyltransferase [Ferrimonas senticii]
MALTNKITVAMTMLAASLAAPLAAETQPTLSAVAEGNHRSAAHIERNQFRHPVETLELFGIHPDMTVVELWPGGGWYSEILAPYLKPSGKFIAASFDTSGKPDSYRVRVGKKYQQKLSADPANYGDAEVIVFNPPADAKLGVESSVDMVLTFRNLHNWAKAGTLEQVFQSAFDVLTPGGVFGVVEHRGPSGDNYASGYMEQDAVIALAEKVGFRLAVASEINANPKDIKDYPRGVWTLPPVLALKDQDKAKYQAIGESDRMTLKFYKPEI